MTHETFRVVRRGVGMSIQDAGRPGLARFGIPPSGVMDDHAAAWANRLLDNPPVAPVVEILMQGTHLEVLRTCWIAITGADARCNFPRWRIVRAHAGEGLVFPLLQKGLWTYVAVEGGFSTPCWLGSASVYPRGRIGRALGDGDVLHVGTEHQLSLPPPVAGRLVSNDEIRDYQHPPAIRLWRGPQWDLFPREDRSSFFQQTWSVSAQSDRVGYRLEGGHLSSEVKQIISEPVLVGSVQVPPGGQPIVTMRDGPTVGGYPKIGLVDPADLSWLAQCRPGVPFQFRLADQPASSPD
ncbi:MAG TPA: allophanate hydrolase [Verrucomicrobiales bacterium]|nr:allophanate hydrolase [Verrucomicrobiales bacterium]